jgi:hypothetical protein
VTAPFVSPRSPRELLRRWLLACRVFAVLLFFFCPQWAAFRLWARVPELAGMIEVRRGVSVLAQAAAGAAITDPLHAAIQWRLLFPVIGYLFGRSPFFPFGLAHVGAVFVLVWPVTLARRAGLAWFRTAAAVIGLGAALWCFTSTGWLGYCDSWLAVGLLLAVFAKARGLAWAACLWPRGATSASPLPLHSPSSAGGWNGRRPSLSFVSFL